MAVKGILVIGLNFLKKLALWVLLTAVIFFIITAMKQPLNLNMTTAQSLIEASALYFLVTIFWPAIGVWRKGICWLVSMTTYASAFFTLRHILVDINATSIEDAFAKIDQANIGALVIGGFTLLGILFFWKRRIHALQSLI